MAPTAVAVTTMKVAQVSGPGAAFQIVEREIPEPQTGHVRIKVQACGVCHSDVLTKEGLWPGIQFPRVPGHEVAGIVDKVGAGVSSWKAGQRVGVGWHGGHDNTCRECRRGDFGNCQNFQIAGISYDGGYQQYMIAPSRHSLHFRRHSVMWTQRRCFAPESPLTTHCDTAAHSLAILSQYKESAA